MLNTIMYILLAIGLIYSYVVLGKWHKLSKKFDVLAEDMSKELNREVGCIVSNTISSLLSVVVGISSASDVSFCDVFDWSCWLST